MSFPLSHFSSANDDEVENGCGGSAEQVDDGESDSWVEEKMFCHHCDESLAGHR